MTDSMTLTKQDRASARKVAGEWARRFYADAVADAGRVADAERAIRSQIGAQSDSAAQFLTTNKDAFRPGIDADELWSYYWAEASEALQKRLRTGVGAPRRNPPLQLPVGTIVPSTAGVPRRGRASGSDNLEGSVNINNATSEELQMLPGIGPRVANEILALRRRLGGRFDRVDVLREQIDGIGGAVWARISPHLVLEGTTSLVLRVEPQTIYATQGEGVRLRVRFENEPGFTLKEVEVACASSKPRKIEACALETINKHVVEPALRDVTQAIALNIADGSVVLSMDVKHCASCVDDGHPRLRDVRIVKGEQTPLGFRISGLLDASGKNISRELRSLTVWQPISDLAAFRSMLTAAFPNASLEMA
jgi:competence ComEA-like helix-hairpin-helix protein